MRVQSLSELHKSHVTGFLGQLHEQKMSATPDHTAWIPQLAASLQARQSGCVVPSGPSPCGDTMSAMEVIENGVLGMNTLVHPSIPLAGAEGLASMPAGPPPHLGTLRTSEMAVALELDFLLNLDSLAVVGVHPVRCTWFPPLASF